MSEQHPPTPKVLGRGSPAPALEAKGGADPVRSVGLRTAAGFGVVAWLLTMVVSTHAETGEPGEPPEVHVLRAWRGDLSAPTRLAAGADGTMLVTDPARGQIVARLADGRIAWRRSGLGRPVAAALDTSGNVLVANLADGSVTAWSLPTWTEVYRLGVGAGEFMTPMDVGVAPSTGRIYVADAQADLVKVYEPGGAYRSSFGGTGAEAGQLNYPVALDVDAGSGNIDVVDRHNYRVQVFSPDGEWLAEMGEYGDEEGSLLAPQGVWTDASAHRWVVDASRARVVVFDSAGIFLGEYGEYGAAPGQLRLPSDVLIDASGRLWVASTNNGRLESFGVDSYDDPETTAPAYLRLDTTEIPRSGTYSLRVEIPGYRLEEVVDDSVEVNGVAATAIEEVDQNGDGEPELLLEFDAALLVEATETSPGTLVATGEMSTLRFESEGMEVTIAPEVPVDSAETGGNAPTAGVDISVEGVGAEGDPAKPGGAPAGCGCAADGGGGLGAAALLALLALRRRA